MKLEKEEKNKSNVSRTNNKNKSRKNSRKSRKAIEKNHLNQKLVPENNNTDKALASQKRVKT